MGAAGPPALTHEETKARRGRAGHQGQQGPRRGRGAPGPKVTAPACPGRRMGGDPQASPGARPPSAARTGPGSTEAAAAAAAAGGAGASAQPGRGHCRRRRHWAIGAAAGRAGRRAAEGGEGRRARRKPGARGAPGPGAGGGAQEAGEAGRGRRRRRPGRRDRRRDRRGRRRSRSSPSRGAQPGAARAPPAATDMMFPQSRHSVSGARRLARPPHPGPATPVPGWAIPQALGPASPRSRPGPPVPSQTFPPSRFGPCTPSRSAQRPLQVQALCPQL